MLAVHIRYIDGSYKNVLTESDIISRCRAWSFSAASRYRILYHSEKLIDLKNFLYRPDQSPLIPVVNWGPDASNVDKNSSGLKGLGNGADWNIRKKYL